MTDTTAKQTLTIDTSSAKELAVMAERYVAGASKLVIDSPELYDIATEELRTIKTAAKQIEEKRKSIVDPLNKALAATNALFKAPMERLAAAESTIKRAMVAWTEVQQRLAAKAAAEARERELAERQRLAAEAEAAQEAARKAQAEAMAAADAQDESKAIAASVAAVQAEQQAAAAEAAAAVTTVAPRFEAPVKAAGISMRKTYKHEVTDLMDLVKAVAEGKAPLQALAANDQFLRAQATAYKQAGQLYPGVTVIESASVSARSL